MVRYLIAKLGHSLRLCNVSRNSLHHSRLLTSENSFVVSI